MLASIAHFKFGSIADRVPVFDATLSAHSKQANASGMKFFTEMKDSS
jgi:hypothetical protein